MKPRVIIVLLNYEREDELLRCYESIQATAYPNMEVIVVDNNSGDRSVARFRREAPTVEIMETGRNKGYAGGMNVGIRAALERSAEYVFLLNSDTMLEKHSLEYLVTALEEHPSAAGATGTIFCHPETDQVWYAGGRISYWRMSGYASHAAVSTDAPPVDVTFLSGCAMVLRAKPLEAVGLFDERFFMYCEDVDLCARLIAKGSRLLHVPKALIYHRSGVTQRAPLPLYFTIRNRLLLTDRIGGSVQRFAGKLFLFVSTGSKMLWWSVWRRDLVRPALFAIQDYLAGTFSEGRGRFFEQKRISG